MEGKGLHGLGELGGVRGGVRLCLGVGGGPRHSKQLPRGFYGTKGGLAGPPPPDIDGGNVGEGGEEIVLGSFFDTLDGGSGYGKGGGGTSRALPCPSLSILQPPTRESCHL